MLKVALLTVLVVGAIAAVVVLGPARDWAVARIKGDRTIGDVVAEYGPAARKRMAPAFEKAGVAYPPKQLTLAAIKSERLLEVWAHEADGPRLVTTYEVLGASGETGPKLKEGDRQVPEGVYRVEGLNPNSSLHLSIKLDYPNAFDREHAESDGRTDLGGNIFIHGGSTSVGCLAMGDEVVEELFVLVDDVGRENVRVVTAPVDPRTQAPPEVDNAPEWLPELYEAIWAEFEPLALTDGG